LPERGNRLRRGGWSTLTDPAWSASCRGAATSRWWVLGWLLPLFVQIAHTMAVAPAYHVGSFDDDANYLMAAHVLAAGGGLSSTMPSGASVVANYLPGYPMLLVPLIWLFGGALWPPRLLSGLCIAALYPLLWAWMGRRQVKPSYRVAVLGLLAINTVVATYSTMVMAEAPFVLVFVLTLFALDRWERHAGLSQAAVVILLLGALIWLKEAGIGLVIGLVLYQLWRRRWSRAIGVTLGVSALLLPGMLARWLSGGATVGDRYADEIANAGYGGFLHGVPQEAVRVAWSYLQDVLRQSVLPTGSPLPTHGSVPFLMALVGATVPVFGIIGAVVWYRRHPLGESWMVWAYFAETLAYPYTNQRRVILVLPIVTIWYVVGAAAVGRALLALGGHALSRVVASIAVVVAVLVAGVPTAVGFTRDYLWNVGQKSSEFARSPAMTLLKAIGPPSAVVETDYRGSVAFFSDHRTAWTAFTASTVAGPFAPQGGGACSVPVVKGALQADDAQFLMVGDVNGPGVMDSPCLLHMATSAASGPTLGAVRLLSSDHDQTSVFELLGPGSSQPEMTDWTARAPISRATPSLLPPNGTGDDGGVAYSAPAKGGVARFKWSWDKPVAISQLSIGLVTSSSPVLRTTVSLKSPNGEWQAVSVVSGAIGNDGAVPYLLDVLGPGTDAVALHVSVQTTGTAAVAYVSAIGPGQPVSG
jgi:hypothetical protein